MLVVVVARSAQGKISDPDLWWHLKTGAIIAATGQVPHADPFSFTKAGQPWTAHEWLSELLFFGIYRAWGWGGILWFRSLMLAAVVAIVYFVLRRRCSSFVVAIFLAVGVALATSSFWSERPHLFSYLFFAALLGVLDQAAQGRRKLLWGVPLVMVVWANLHGGFFGAFILMGAALVGAWIDARLGTDPGSDPAGLIKPLFIVILLCVAAACFNPQGPSILVYPLRYIRERGLATYVSEWQVPNVKEPLGRLFEVLLLGIMLLGLATRLRWRWRDIVPLMVFAHLGLSAVRHIPLYGMMAIATFAGVWPTIGAWLNEKLPAWPLTRRLWEQLQAERQREGVGEETTGTRVVSVILVFSAVAICWLMAPKRNTFEGMVKRTDIPYEAGEWLQRNIAPGRIFNYYDYGGYLIYLPRSGQEVSADENPYKVLCDGREDVYGGKMMMELERHANHAGTRWQELLDGKYRADIVFWPNRLALTRVLEGRPQEWEKVYLSPARPPKPGETEEPTDNRVAIFRRRVPTP